MFFQPPMLTQQSITRGQHRLSHKNRGNRQHRQHDHTSKMWCRSAQGFHAQPLNDSNKPKTRSLQGQYGRYSDEFRCSADHSLRNCSVRLVTNTVRKRENFLRVVCILTVGLYNKHLCGVLTASNTAKAARNNPNGSPAPPTSGSLSLNEPEVMVTWWEYTVELRNERDYCTYCVVLCDSKQLGWRPSTLTIYCPVVTICTVSLTFNNSTFCPHSVFMCFVLISEQTAVISLYNINWLVL
jgi:hypothetical protein